LAKYLVTGGAGFIGSNNVAQVANLCIVEKLIDRKESVKVLDNFSTGRQENIEAFMNQIELIDGDVRDLDTVNELRVTNYELRVEVEVASLRSNLEAKLRETKQTEAICLHVAKEQPKLMPRKPQRTRIELLYYEPPCTT